MNDQQSSGATVAEKRSGLRSIEALKADIAEAFARRDFTAANVQLSTALAAAPDDPELLIDKAGALINLGRQTEALPFCERGVAARPDIVQGHLNLAIAKRATGRAQEALPDLERATVLDPHNIETHCLFGATLLDLHRPIDSLPHFDRALSYSWTHIPSLINRATALVALGRTEDALRDLELAFRVNPNDRMVLLKRAETLRNLRRFREAGEACNSALALDSQWADAFNTRGNVLRDLGWRDEALADYQRAIEIDPGHVGALSNLAYVLMELHRSEEAISAFQALLQISPDFPDVPASLEFLRRKYADWSGSAAALEEISAAATADRRAGVPFEIAHLIDSPSILHAAAKTYASAVYPAREPVWQGERYDHQRLRIAYVSSDLREHSVGRLAAGLFESHDRARFEVTGLSLYGSDGSALQKRIAQACDRYIDASAMSDRAIAEWMHQNHVDLTVDLNGLTQGCRPGIFALRPAPIQVNYLGYPGTMGASFYDYLVADVVVIPPELETHYSERILRVSGSYQINDRARPSIPDVPTRASAGLPPKSVVLACFNTAFKISRDIFGAWMRVLQQTPNTVLWLLFDSDLTSKNLREAAVAYSIAPDRIHFAPRAPTQAHLARHALADLFLDTYPYNAHTTGSDALWSGVPMVGLRGQSFAARVSASLLNAVGLPELVTTSLESYQAMIVELANNPEQLKSLRMTLNAHRQSARLFDTVATTRALEKAFEYAIDRSRHGLPPTTFDVPN